jgi:uncharacterized protein involved in exopolysaccharide biosynthesis
MTQTEMRPRGPRPEPDLDFEEEVDLGRYWHALAARWWVPVIGVALGAVVGLLAAAGGARSYEARGVVYLGTPHGPGGEGALQNLPTRLAMLNEFIRSRDLVREISGRVDIPIGRLRSAITVDTIPGVERPRFESPSPLVEVLVRQRSARVANEIVNLVSGHIVRGFSTFVDLKLENYEERRKRAERRLVVTAARLERAEKDYDEALATQARLRTNPARLDPAAQLILLANNANTIQFLSNRLQFYEARQATLDGTLLTLSELIAQAEQVERARVIERAEAHRESGPSRRTGAIVGALIGLLVGVLVALLWEPVARRVRSRQAAG